MVPTMFRLPCDCSTGPQTKNGLEPDLSKTLPQKLWNNLPESILKVESVEGFRRRLKNFQNPEFSFARFVFVLFFAKRHEHVSKIWSKCGAIHMDIDMD